MVIYNKYALTEGQMSAANLLDFLQTEQKESVSLEDAQKLIEKYEPDQTGNGERGLILSVCLLDYCTFTYSSGGLFFLLL